MRFLLSLLILAVCYGQAQSQTVMRFDGIDDYIYVNSYPSLNWEHDFTLEAQVREPDFSRSSVLTIMERYDQEKQEGWRLQLKANSLELVLGTQTFAVPCAVTEQRHLVVAREGAALYFYADGVLIGEHFLSEKVNGICVDCDLYLGNQKDLTAPFKGHLQTLKLWNKALSLEARSVVNSSFPKALVGHWNFAAGAGQFVNNHASPLHYGRLGQTFYKDKQDATWAFWGEATKGDFAPDFTINNNDPKEGEVLDLTNKSLQKGTFYWWINHQKYNPEQLSMVTFASGMNIIQLVQESETGRAVTTKMVTIKGKPKACGSSALMDWRETEGGRKIKPKSKPTSSTITAKTGTPVPNGGPYVIPVVFHIIGTQAELDAFNLASGRVEAQLLELNTQFANNNTNISFCLAKRLPVELVNAGRTWASFGTASTPGRQGVTYTLDDATTNLNISTYDLTDIDLVYNRLPAVLPFDPEEYMSVYVTPTVLLPSGMSALGISNVGSSGEPVDGPGVAHDGFAGGLNNLLGRVLVHEVGHWLSLYHVFGVVGDFVDDTYEQDLATNTPPLGPGIPPVTNCTTPYTTGIPTGPFVPYFRGQNHMDYHIEACQDVFTIGQGNRMQVNLDNDRTFIHTELNLINTGLQAPDPTSCIVGNNFTAAFTLSSKEICEGNAFTAEGFSPSSGVAATFFWDVSWSATNTTPAPAFTVNHSNQTGRVNDITITGSAGVAAGFWTVELTMVANGTTTLVHTNEIHLLDCSVSPQRYRKTTNFNNNDWGLNGISIANGETKDAQNNVIDGYVVVGSDLSATPTTGVLLFVNTLGEILWRKTIATTAGNVRLYDVASPITFQGNANCYAMTGYTESNGNKEVLVLIMDELGVTLYQETFPMSDNGQLYPYALGKQIVQLSSAFGNQLAIVGFAGMGNAQLDQKAGFVLGIDPTQALGSSLQWSQFYESTIDLSNHDHDFVENIVETTTTINGQQKDVLIVSGNSNRYNRSTAGLFLSCLSIATNTVTEEWVVHYEAAGGNIGTYRSLGTVLDNGRLFLMAYGHISHGTFICEVNTENGVLGDVFEIKTFMGNEILIDNGSCVVFGRHYTDLDVNAFKMALPATINDCWGLPSTVITRRYDGTVNFSVPPNIEEGLQNFVRSPNGGYMGMTVIDVNQVSGPSKEMTMIKVDDFLVNGCANLTNFRLGSLPNPFESNPVIEIPTTTVAQSTATVTATTEGAVCIVDGCLDAYHFNKNEQRCEPTLQLLVSDVVPAGANYSYQWSPITDLDDPTIMEPTTSTTIDQGYNLIVTNTNTGCQVVSVSYSVAIPTTINFSTQQIVCNTAPAAPFPLDLIAGVQSGYTYQWSPSTFLDNPYVLQPNCSAVTNQTYQLIATPIIGSGNCSSIITTLEVLVNNQSIQEVNGFCINETYPGYFFDASQTNNWQDRLDLDLLYTHFSTTPLPANGYWVIEPYSGQNPLLFNYYNNLPRFDISNNSIPIGVINSYQVEYLTYIYPDPSSICGDSRWRIKLHPDNNIQTNSNLEICAGDTVTFQGNAINLTAPSTNVYTYWNLSTAFNCISSSNNAVNSNTFTYVFPNPSPCNTYLVSRHGRYDCPNSNVPGGIEQRLFTSNIINIDAVSGNPSILVDNCQGTLVIDYQTSSNPTIKWYEVGNPIPLATTNSFLPPHPGDYYAEVIADQGCDFITDPFTYQGPLSSTWTTTGLACATSTATATVVPVGGQAPYTYLWSAAASGQTTATATGLTAGSYEVTLTDANGCEVYNTVQIVAGDPLQIQLTVTPINCYVANSAAIVSVVSNGTAPYTYLWSNGATTSDLTGTQIPTAGDYCVTLTDANGCVTSACATVNPLVDVDFSKTSSVTQAQAGDEITYTIYMKNNCQYPVSFDLTDVLPAGVVPTQVGSFSYNTTTHNLTQQITLQGGVTQTYDYKVLIVADGSCNRSLTLKNQITAQSLDNPAITLVRNAAVEVTEDRDDCDISAMNITFAQAIQAQSLLPMTGTNNATNTAQTVVINGTWRLAPGQVYHFAPGSKVLMEAGAEIIISKDAQLTIEGTLVNGCSCLWHRILVESAGELIVSDHSTLKDAQYAIETENEAVLTIKGSRFEDNFIGWYTAPVNNPMSQRINLTSFNENYFASSNLKPAFSGALATPALDKNGRNTTIALPVSTGSSRLVGLAGVYLWDMKEVRIETSQPSDNNHFEYLVTGITAFDSKLFVNAGVFYHIAENNTFYASNLGLQGAAIHGQGGGSNLSDLEVLGTGNTSNVTTFFDSDIGVSAINTSVDVDFCIMEQIKKVGIKTMDCNDAIVNIKANTLTDIHLVGIEFVGNQGQTMAVAAYNHIVMDYSAVNAAQFRAGISASNCYAINVTENYVESFSSQFGIVCNEVTQSDVSRNEVFLVGSYNNVVRTGIAIYGGKSSVSCNTIYGNQDVRLASNTRALSGRSLSSSLWFCNELSNTYTGAYFESSNILLLKGTVFEEHHTGLFLASNATIGTQFEHGNVWVPGTITIDAENQNVGNLAASLLEVNPAYTVPNTWPSTIIPNNNNWVVQTSGRDNTFNCNTASDGDPICDEPLVAFPARTVISNNTTTAANDGHRSEYKDNQEAWELILYPNPAVDHLTLESSQALSKACQVEVYNALGQVMPVSIQLQTTQQIVLELSKLTPGFYTVRLIDQGAQSNQTFIVRKP
ncbi:MAG: T9SS type A sorting domain-containing protein [Aureispira sp.]